MLTQPICSFTTEVPASSECIEAYINACRCADVSFAKVTGGHELSV